MTTVVVPRDRSGVFLADLTADDFLVFGDDRPQQVVSLVRVLGGRAGGQLAPPRLLPGESSSRPHRRRASPAMRGGSSSS